MQWIVVNSLTLYVWTCILSFGSDFSAQLTLSRDLEHRVSEGTCIEDMRTPYITDRLLLLHSRK